mgnify:CR=1 FL=1
MSDLNSFHGDNILPIGSVIYWAGLDANYPQILNAGYMKCNGDILAVGDSIKVILTSCDDHGCYSISLTFLFVSFF